MTRSYYRVESADGTLSTLFRDEVSGSGTPRPRERRGYVMSSGYVDFTRRASSASARRVSCPRACNPGRGIRTDRARLTDTNLCGALEFANLADALGLKPITGGELVLSDGSRVVLLAKSRVGYSNLSQLLTFANRSDRREPKLDAEYLPRHAEGLLMLTGGRDGRLSRLLVEGRHSEAMNCLRQLTEWYGP